MMIVVLHREDVRSNIFKAGDVMARREHDLGLDIRQDCAEALCGVLGVDRNNYAAGLKHCEMGQSEAGQGPVRGQPKGGFNSGAQQQLPHNTYQLTGLQ